MLDEPVIVLTGARSGSTLLRLILDAHPDLACPPETNIVKTCAQLASAFAVVDGAPAGDDVPESVRNGVHATVDGLFRGHLARRDRLRWCDKSLGTAPVAGWFARLYPKARFICLYRHCMDVVHSGLDASPWGLMGYGFEQFAGLRSGNNVAALAAYWIEYTGRIMEFERAHADRCVRVHYERLVRDPERTAAEIFAAIGVSPVPGIAERCFGPDAAAIGPGDHKVRATGRITADSVGRGVKIPVGMIQPAQLTVINHLLGELGYAPVDDAWRRSACPPEPLPGVEDGDRPATPGGEVARTVLRQVGKVVHARIRAGFLREPPVPGPDGSTFDLVAYHADGDRTARRWRVDLTARTVTETDARADAGPAADWVVTGDVGTWLAVLGDRANMASCLRSGDLRYIPGGPAEPPGNGEDPVHVARVEGRLSVVRRLLGLAGYSEEVDGPTVAVP